MWRDVKWIVLLAIVASISCSLFSNEESAPEIPGKLVYSAPDENGRYQIYTSLTNDTKKKQLTQSGAEEAEFFNPSWSNDGTQIALTSTLESSSNGLSLYIMNADGSDLRPLKERPNSQIVTPGSNPVWSPDDSKIAFDWCTNCELGGNNFEIYAYDFKTDSIQQITDNLARDFFPKWSNVDSSSIIFKSNRKNFNEEVSTFKDDLFVFNYSNQKILQITDTSKVGAFAQRPNDGILLIRPFELEGKNWFLLNLKNQKAKDFILPETIDKERAAPVKWSKNGDAILIRSLVGNNFVYNFYDIMTERLIEIDIVDLKRSDLDWIQNN
tara:strand:- start:57 stop:1034 length:978 start_codon:yes stop_codon:yes gene_type:complete